MDLKSKRLLASVFALACLVRLYGLARHGKEEVVFGVSMAMKHQEIARNLDSRGIIAIAPDNLALNAQAIKGADGKSRLVDLEDMPEAQAQTQEPEPYFGRMPGYPILLVATWKIFGQKRFIYAQTITALLDALAAGLCFLIGLRLFGIWPGLLAGLLYALWPPAAILSYSPGHDAPGSFFVILSLYLCLKAVAQNTVPRWLAAGAALAAATLFRQNPFLLPFAWALPLYLLLGARGAARATALIFSVCLTVNALWGLRNYKTFGRFNLTMPLLGNNLLIGIGDEPNPWGVPGEEEAFKEWIYAKMERRPPMFSQEFDRTAMQEFKRIVREAPFWYLRLLAKRSFKSLAPTFLTIYPGPYEFKRDFGGSAKEYIRQFPSAALAHWSIKLAALSLWPLALAAFFLYPAQRKLILLIWMIPLYYWAAHLPQRVEYRYMIPGFVPLFIPAAATVATILKKNVNAS